MSTAADLLATKRVVDSLVATGRISLLEWMFVIDDELPDDEVTVYVAREGDDYPREAYYQAGTWISAWEPHTLTGVYAWAHVPALPPIPTPISEEDE